METLIAFFASFGAIMTSSIVLRRQTKRNIRNEIEQIQIEHELIQEFKRARMLFDVGISAKDAEEIMRNFSSTAVYRDVEHEDWLARCQQIVDEDEAKEI